MDKQGDSDIPSKTLFTGVL